MGRAGQEARVYMSKPTGFNNLLILLGLCLNSGAC